MKQKKKVFGDEELEAAVDKAIQELVYEKEALVKAYNYYHGKRDPAQFKHLEDNFGIGTPTSVEFVPLIRKHIEILIGEYLSAPLSPKVSCKDSITISNINRDKKLKVESEVMQYFKKEVNSKIYAAIMGEASAQDETILAKIEEIKKATNENFTSDYEIAGQYIVEYICQNSTVDFKNKLKTILTDMLVTGMCYFRTLPSPSGTNMQFDVLNVLDTFIDRNPNSPYLNKSYRAVVRKYLTREQIFVEFGEYLSEDDIDSLDKASDYGEDNFEYLTSTSSTISSRGDSNGILGGMEVIPNKHRGSNSHLLGKAFPVYDVELRRAEKEGGVWVTNLYRGIRIDQSIYVLFGKVEDVTRSMDDPKDCSLSINGMFYADRNGDPFSLVLATASLQDKYDVLCFYRDNVIAESGTVGDWVDLAHMPKFLGDDATKRLIKWKAYSKGGLKLYDSSQEGTVVNTAFNGFDDTVKLNGIQAIGMAINSVEETCSSITGVFRERLNGIEQKDAVSNVQVGVKNSALITKQYYYNMDLITRESLVSLLNIAKITYKKGITGTLVLGDKLNKIFTALPEHYSFTDYDIHIVDSAEIVQETATIKEIAMEFASNGMVTPDVVVNAITSKSLTGLRRTVLNSVKAEAEKNDQVSQLSQQLQESQQQLQQAQQQVEKLSGQVEQFDQSQQELDKAKMQAEFELKWFEARSKDSLGKKKVDNDDKKVQLEALQLVDNNENNDEIRN